MKYQAIYAWTIFLFQGLQSYNADATEVFITATQGSVAFEMDLHIIFSEIKEIRWKLKSLSIAKILNDKAEIDSSEFGNRLHLLNNGTLWIKNVKTGDAGEYVASITMKNGTRRNYKYLLFVHEPVSLPNIKHTLQPGASGNFTCNITLECSTQNGTNVTFSWKKKTESQMNSTSCHNGSIFQDVLEGTNVKITYTCEARNPVSLRTASFNPTASCPNEKPGFDWILVAAAGAGGILILTVIFVICRRKQKNRRRDDINTYYDTILNSKADGILTTPPDGNISVYATVQDMDLTPSPLKKKNDCVTVYSTVSSVKTKPATKAQKSNQPLTVYATVESVKKKRHSKILQSPTSVTIYEEVKVPESQKDMSHYEK